MCIMGPGCHHPATSAWALGLWHPTRKLAGWKQTWFLNAGNLLTWILADLRAQGAQRRITITVTLGSQHLWV